MLKFSHIFIIALAIVLFVIFIVYMFSSFYFLHISLILFKITFENLLFHSSLVPL